jgi:hypothetical protein
MVGVLDRKSTQRFSFFPIEPAMFGHYLVERSAQIVDAAVGLDEELHCA